MSETALGRKKWYPYLRESASRDLSLHSFISRFQRERGRGNQIAAWRDEHPVHESKILWGFSPFAWLPSWLCMMFFSNIVLGGLIFQTCSSRNPSPLFYHFCPSFSSLSYFSYFPPCWFYPGFLRLVLICFHGSADDSCLTWSAMKLSVLYPESRLFISSFFFHLETPKTYIWRLISLFHSLLCITRVPACFLLFSSLYPSLPANSTDICYFDPSTTCWS